jgi:hypothetical protein
VPNGGRTTSTSNYREDGSKQQMDLGAVAATWPTPTAQDAKHATNSPAQLMRHEGNLVVNALTWPTANAHDGRRPGSDETSTQGANLKRDAERWPMLQQHHSPSPPDPPIPVGLKFCDSDQTSRQHWRSPMHATENSLRGAGQDPAKRAEQGHAVGLQDQVAAFSQTAGTRRRLNPRFVEWLLGFPLGWTEPCETAPSGSGA